MEQLGFSIAAFGCTTCIGNSGPLHPELEKAQVDHNIAYAAALSGNRNFEGRVHQHVKGSFLVSPLLVVAYALAGKIDLDLSQEIPRHLQGRQGNLPTRHLAQ
jgi:aconitate hydratase